MSGWGESCKSLEPFSSHIDHSSRVTLIASEETTLFAKSPP
jgi:hypothetical protein